MKLHTYHDCDFKIYVSHGDPRTIAVEEEFKGGYTSHGMHKRNSKRGLIFPQNDPIEDPWLSSKQETMKALKEKITRLAY